MNKQEVFDKVARHLLEQGEPCLDRDGRFQTICKYRNSAGQKCAVGCLITNEAYDPDIEGRGVQTPEVCAALVKSGIDVFTVEDRFIQSGMNMLRELQNMHDNCSSYDWKNQLMRIAALHDVNFPEDL